MIFFISLHIRHETLYFLHFFGDIEQFLQSVFLNYIKVFPFAKLLFHLLSK